MKKEFFEALKGSPIIAAVKDKNFDGALKSPVKVIFLLGAGILTLKQRVDAAHKAKKFIFVHMDLAEGIGKDRYGVKYLSMCGVDGIISTKSAIIRAAKECGMLTVQRFFAYDSQGVESIDETLYSTNPDIAEIMPGVIGKIIERFSKGSVPLIAGGLIDKSEEVAEALKLGAIAISTGKEELWKG